MTINESQYGEDAQTNKRYQDLQPKSKAVVDAIVDRSGERFTQREIADEVDCSNTHVTYVKDNFPHIIENRRSTMRTVADGGEGAYDIALSSTDAFKMVKLLPEDLSKKVWNQIRRQGRTDGGGLNQLFDDDGNMDNE